MNLLTESLWGDEAFASILAQKNLLDIITTVARDTSPPLHYLLLHFWMQLFGSSELAIRAFPLLLFLLLILVVYGFTRDIFGEKAAHLAGVLTFLNPFLFLYAFEARMYMLLALTATASMWFFVTKRWKLYILITVAGLYTHHFSIFIVFVQVIYYLLTNFKLSLKYYFKSPFIRSLLFIIILYLPWLPTLYGQTRMVTGDFWLARPSIYDLRDLFYHFIIGTTKIGFENFLLWLTAFILISKKWKVKLDGILILWVVLPAIITYSLSQISRPLFFDRYLIVSVSAIPIILASNIKKPAHLLVLILASGLLWINIQAFQNPTKQPFRELAQFVKTTYNQDQIVINYYTNALHYFEMKHYGLNVKVYSPSGPLPFWVGTALIDKKDVLEKLPENPILLVMVSGDIKRVQIPGYQQVRSQKFRDLYLLWFISPITL